MSRHVVFDCQTKVDNPLRHSFPPCVSVTPKKVR
jgi:hypothetical protein